MKKKLKILHTVELYPPSMGGMQEVVKQLSERLVALGHTVTVATAKLSERKSCMINGVKIKEFAIKGNLVRGITGETKEYKKFLLDSRFDIITNFAAQQWASDLTFDLLDKINAKKVFIPTGFSGFYQPEYKKYFQRMKIWMAKYDMNIFNSYNYRDINFAKKCGIKKITVIPNGAGKDEFLKAYEINIRKKLGISTDHFLILHVGSHTGLKGHKETIEIFEKAKIRNATFLIVANSFSGGCTNFCKRKKLLFKLSPKRFSDKKRLIITSLSRKETVAAYKEADLFLFPSNIECSPLVLFECMASKTPFLTTDAGNAAEIIKWSKSGLLLPTTKDKHGYSKADIEKSSKLLEDLYFNEKKRDSMSKSGYKAWSQKFTWEKIAKDYEELYKDLFKVKR